MTRRHYLAAGLMAADQFVQAQEPARKIGIIGLGARSRAHLAALARMPEARITALCDVDSSRIGKAASDYDLSAVSYTDYRELIRDQSVATVVIAAPNYLHHEMAIAALRAGKNVVLEKPMGINYEQAVGILREARRSGRTIAVAMQRRYTRQDREMLQAVESGLAGPIKLIQCTEMRGDWNAASWQYTDPVSGARTNWRFLKRTAGSTELEFSIHSFAHISMLVKSPLARVFASGGTVFYKDRDTRDLSNVLVDFENGARLNYAFSCFAPGGGNTFSILCEKGILRREAGKLLFSPHRGKSEPVPVAAAPSEDRAELLFYRDFFRDAAAGKPSMLGPEFAIEPAKIAFAAEISIAGNRVVTARDFPPA
ncbi:MAG: Gfo/Idh/MocA family oxidoreductase [Acidobacteria bacterium]|nr:Gfo/Idh/MocA family oxidoreductase [Acidobacteriota bacterium]